MPSRFCLSVLLIVLTAWPLVALAGANPCANEVNLAAPGKPFGVDPANPPHRILPIRSQGDRGLCYAYAGSQLVDAWRFTHQKNPVEKPSRNFPIISPIDAAIGTANWIERADDTVDMGRVEGIVNYLSEHPEFSACNERDAFAAFGLETDGKTQATHLLNLVEKSWDEFAKLRKDIYRMRELAQKYESLPPGEWTAEMKELADLRELDLTIRKGQSMSRSYSKFLKAPGRAVHLNELFCLLEDGKAVGESFRAITITHDMVSELLWSESKLNFFKTFFDRTCSDSRFSLPTLPDPVMSLYLPHESKQVETDINKKLSEPNPQPVAVTFCPSVLESPSKETWHFVAERNDKGQPIKSGCRNADPKDPEGWQSHIALVIGRRPHPTRSGACQFLLRNSWGTGCDRYKKAGWSDCKDGEVWIDADRISANTWKTTYIGEKKPTTTK